MSGAEHLTVFDSGIFCMSGAERLTVLDSGIKGGGNIEGQVKFSVIWSPSPSESLHAL